jgi:starvation-inducible DNA-binding protein
MQANVSEHLQKILANAIVFQHKLQHFHWSVTGPRFFSLHAALEKMYEEWSEQVDEVAERVRALGGTPHPTLAGAVKQANLQEQPSVPDDAGMAREILGDLHTQIEGYRQAIQAADQGGDRSTVNLLEDALLDTEKTAWMFRAWLKE